jgi:hypothetical protein
MRIVERHVQDGHHIEWIDSEVYGFPFLLIIVAGAGQYGHQIA